MPKMDGITAVKRLKTALPECSIIFISAYTEKTYFKEAIHLKAVSFVEKPINHEELKNVIQKAVEEQRQNRNRKETEKQVFYFNERQLVKRLTKNLFHNEEEMEEVLASAGIQKKAYSVFCSVIVLHCEKREIEEERAWNLYSTAVEENAADAPCLLLGMQKQEGVVVYCAFLKGISEYPKLLEWIKEQLGNTHYYYILGGSAQSKTGGFQKSYNDAVMLKNKAFYSSYGSVLNCENENITFTLNTDEWKNKFIEYIKLERFDKLEKELERYKNGIMANQQIHYKLVCELYLYVYSELCKYAENRMLISGENG